jgi:hypothetical protein
MMLATIVMLGMWKISATPRSPKRQALPLLLCRAWQSPL